VDSFDGGCDLVRTWDSLPALATQTGSQAAERGGRRQELLDARREALEQEEQLRSTSDLLPLLMWMSGPDGGRSFFSRHWLTFTCCEAAQLMGNGWLQRVHPEDRERCAVALQHALSRREPFTLEYRLSHFSGEYRWVFDRGWPRVHRTGVFLGYAGSTLDISERKAMEEEQARLTGILEATPDLVCTASLDGTIRFLNRAGRALLGLGDTEPLNGLRLSDCHPPWAQCVIDLDGLPAALDQGHWSAETAVLTRQGKEIPVWQVLVAHKGPDGQSCYLSTVARDLTAHKRLEHQFRQAQKMEAVGRLAAGVAHDFNNLLTIIGGYSALLLHNPNRADGGRSYLEQIQQAGERASTLVRQLLAFSRKQVQRLEVVDVNNLLLHMEKMLRRLIGEDVQLTTALAPDLGPVRADPSQLEQVVMNLAVNARDAMPTGGRLTIETRNVDLDDSYCHARPEVKAGRYIQVSVTDTGCGMTADVKSHVFEPFFTTKEPGQGTGLGLATVYGVVKQSNGYVYVYSETGRGTAFKIYLPRISEAVKAPNSAPPSRSPYPAGTETVLIAEDMAEVRHLTRATLVQRGYTVLEAANGEEALAQAAAHPGPIHLLLTDVVMPGMGGRELADRLQAARPGVKVLYVSGYPDDAVVRHGLLTAQVHFLQKPFSPLVLLRKVREVADTQANAADNGVPA
jgi:PAS domain S-box-containing protein